MCTKVVIWMKYQNTLPEEKRMRDLRKLGYKNVLSSGGRQLQTAWSAPSG